MSEYYLADQRADERLRQRKFQQENKETVPKKQKAKVTLLGDFLSRSSESHGCDPYNSLQGATTAETWTSPRERR